VRCHGRSVRHDLRHAVVVRRRGSPQATAARPALGAARCSGFHRHGTTTRTDTTRRDPWLNLAHACAAATTAQMTRSCRHRAGGGGADPEPTRRCCSSRGRGCCPPTDPTSALLRTTRRCCRSRLVRSRPPPATVRAQVFSRSATDPTPCSAPHDVDTQLSGRCLVSYKG
jgi:hypothetical protein